MERPKFLMCPPRYFDMSCAINSRMGQGTVDFGLARAQWVALRCRIGALARVTELPLHPGFPSTVFISKSGVVLGKRVIVNHFAPQERVGEEHRFKKWCQEEGYGFDELPSEVVFEGSSDALYDAHRDLMWAGFGQRSEADALAYLQRGFGLEVVPLRLVHPFFDHLDMCFCPLERGHILYFPRAFSLAGLAAIEQRTSADQRIAVSSQDALQLACNAVNIGDLVIMHEYSAELGQTLRERGYSPEISPVSEFMKAGASVRCLTLRLNESQRNAMQGGAATNSGGRIDGTE